MGRLYPVKITPIRISTPVANTNSAGKIIFSEDYTSGDTPTDANIISIADDIH